MVKATFGTRVRIVSGPHEGKSGVLAGQNICSISLDEQELDATSSWDTRVDDTPFWTVRLDSGDLVTALSEQMEALVED